MSVTACLEASVGLSAYSCCRTFSSTTFSVPLGIWLSRPTSPATNRV